MKAKVDTGARTSALHAFELEAFERNGEQWARFEIHPRQRSHADAHRVEARVRSTKKVRSSNGLVQERPVIETTIGMGEFVWLAEFTLTDRDEMGFRLLLGRSSVRRRFLVDPGRSFLVGKSERT